MYVVVMLLLERTLVSKGLPVPFVARVIWTRHATTIVIFAPE